jgi:hypothetical protein
MPRGETFDRPAGECLGELVTDRVANRLGRSERESVGPKPIEHRAERVGAKPVWREHETPGASALLQEAARKAPPWARSRSGRYLRGRKLVPEGCAASSGEGAVIVFCIEPTIGNHHLVRMHTPARGDCGRASERR